MQAIINFLRGSVLFTVTGAFPERFLNLCAQAGVGFWDLEWLDPHTLRLRVSRRDARRVGPLAEKVLCEARARRHLGFPYFLAGFRKRYALLLGLALSLAAVCLLSRFVLTIEVSGNKTVSTAAILTELSRQGVRVGAYGPGLDVRRISQESLLRLDGLAWMSINLHGTRAEVLVREKLPEPEVRDESTPANVVAQADGVILDLEVLDGQAAFQEGEAVLRGEVVISGTMDLREPEYSAVDAGQRLVHARGNVWARTYRTLTAQIPLEAQVKRYTGEEETQWSLLALGRTVNFFGKGGVFSEGYDKIVETHPLTLPGGRVMPLALRRTEYRAYVTEPAALNAGAARSMLEERLLERLDALIGEDGEVLDTVFTVREEDGMLAVTLRAECREQIGREVPFAGSVGELIPGTSSGGEG
ncbi:MAG TPA: sporulation protein YqfD [Candidatus Intestinimonas pullistercoris]|uniref:Sporulation protein YqfD n=1 Tax=Candidatus Intestinimonas pullistercoris TaxID=2838623 RepID=A0A9D2T0D9_9FIRM|nr:sporulation protein YqfD [uncultured Intestinimonas sp.]HJC40485.1 sporulation protein YqfD [Candidatus Intestinimonas pullistercoris]